MSRYSNWFCHSIVASIPTCHAGDLGFIPSDGYLPFNKINMLHSLHWWDVIPWIKIKHSTAPRYPWKFSVIEAASQMSDMSSWFQDEIILLGTESGPVKFSFRDNICYLHYSTAIGYVAFYRLGPRVHLYPRNLYFAVFPLLMGGDCFARFAKPCRFRASFLYQSTCPFFAALYSLFPSHTHISSSPHRTWPWHSVSNWLTLQPRTSPPMALWQRTITNGQSPILGSRHYQVHEASLLQLGFCVGGTTSSFQFNLRPLSMYGHFRHS